jgi:hypothetical protein
MQDPGPSVETQDRKLAPSASLLGRLQRGRGAGFLSALRAPPSEVWPLLVQCITCDPRWDPQLESRAEYYADLALRMVLDLAPLEAFLRSHDDRDRYGSRVSLTIATLAGLARRGQGRAVETLRDYVSFGRHWASTLSDLLELSDPEAVVGLDQVICDRCPDEKTLLDATGWLVRDRFPIWTHWAGRNPRIARLLQKSEREEAEVAARRTPELYAGLTLEELFGSASTGEHYPLAKAVREKVTPADLDYLVAHLSPAKPETCRLALIGLKELAHPAAWPLLKELADIYPDLRMMLRPILARAIGALPGEVTLEQGRIWFDRPEWHLRVLGGEILEQHATLEDIPRLRAAVPESLTADEMYRLCEVLKILARFPDAGPIPELELAFVEASYSWARLYAAEAMDSLSPEEFSRGFALECLWDCESSTRELACAAVDLSLHGTLERLNELALSSFEEEEVLQAAHEALAEHDPDPDW